ncbi:hypothetical protein GCM10023190_06600 [Enteractinococcus fodinae]
MCKVPVGGSHPQFDAIVSGIGHEFLQCYGWFLSQLLAPILLWNIKRDQIRRLKIFNL